MFPGSLSLLLPEPGNEVLKQHHIERKEVGAFEAICVKRHRIVVIVPPLQPHRRPDSAERLSMSSCLREEREFVKGNGIKQVLSHYF